MFLTNAQIGVMYSKSGGYSEPKKFHLTKISKCAYSDEGGYNLIYETAFFTVINVEYEIFPDGSVTARNWKTGEVIE